MRVPFFCYLVHHMLWQPGSMPASKNEPPNCMISEPWTPKMSTESTFTFTDIPLYCWTPIHVVVFEQYTNKFQIIWFMIRGFQRFLKRGFHRSPSFILQQIPWHITDITFCQIGLVQVMVCICTVKTVGVYWL
jgi:hypothetical protein